MDENSLITFVTSFRLPSEKFAIQGASDRPRSSAGKLHAIADAVARAGRSNRRKASAALANGNQVLAVAAVAGGAALLDLGHAAPDLHSSPS
jgi:hypothetical protein